MRLKINTDERMIDMKCTLIFISGMAISMMAMSFFNMPQQMMNGASQMFAVPEKPQECICVCQNK